MSAIAIEVIRSPDEVNAFRREWERVVYATGAPTPFQTPDWLLTWWDHFGSGRLHILIFRDGTETAGVLPCFLHEWKGRRQLTLIGTGISDYLDPVFDGSRRGRIVEALRSHLANDREWDVGDWQDLSAGTPLEALGEVSYDTPCTQIRFGESFENFLNGRPKDLKRNLRRYREKAEALGEVRFAVTREAAPELLDALIALHAARWQRSGQAGTIESNHAAEFLRAAAEIFARRDWLRIFSVQFKARIAAIVVAFRNQSTIFSYLSAYDPEYEKFGFGRELLLQALQYAHREGYTCWNFLRGEEPYKFSWGAERIPKRRVVVERSSVKQEEYQAAGTWVPS